MSKAQAWQRGFDAGWDARAGERYTENPYSRRREPAPQPEGRSSMNTPNTHDRSSNMDTPSDRTIKSTVKPEIDACAIEEAARLAADYFLASFAAHVAGRTADNDDADPQQPLAGWEASTDPAWNPKNAQGYDLLRSALNAASIDAKASTADFDLVSDLLQTAQGREVMRRLDMMSPPTAQGES